MRQATGALILGIVASICGCALDPGALARLGAPAPTPAPAAETTPVIAPVEDAATSTLITRKDVKVGMFKSYAGTYSSVYSSSTFDLVKGTDIEAADAGHLRFGYLSGVDAKVVLDSLNLDQPLYVIARSEETNRIQINFQDTKSTDFAAQKAAPEFGWNAVGPGERGRIGVKIGNVYLAKIRLNDDQDQLYAKIQVKDFNDLKVTFDYAIQTATGSRQLQ